jgi:hypothetical protein
MEPKVAPLVEPSRTVPARRSLAFTEIEASFLVLVACNFRNSDPVAQSRESKIVLNGMSSFMMAVLWN